MARRATPGRRTPGRSTARGHELRRASLRRTRPPGQPGYDEPLDDESWYEELRRSAPAYPQNFGPQHPSGPHRRVEPQAPGHGQQPGFPQAPDRAAGYGQPRGDWGGSSPQAPQGPQMSAGRMTGPGQRAGSQPGSPFPPGPPAAQGTGFLSAPVAPVGLLTPPDGTRVDALRDGASPAAPAASPRDGLRGRSGPDRPGRQPSRRRHGAAGPWPRRPGDHVLLAGPAPDRRPRVVRGLLAGRRGRGVHGPVRGPAGRVRPRGRPAGSGQPAGRGQTAHRPSPRRQQ